MSIERVADLAEQIVEVEQEILNLEQKIKEKRAELRYLKEFVAPEATDQLDWDPAIMGYDPEGDTVTIRLPNNHIMTVAESFHPHTPKKDNEKRGEILDWLEAHGAGGLLTLDVSLSFRRGEGKKAKQVLAALDAIPEVTYTKDKGIHHSLYQTFCRDRIRKGEDLPELLGVFNRRVATVKRYVADPGLPAEPERRPFKPVKSDGYGDL